MEKLPQWKTAIKKEIFPYEKKKNVSPLQISSYGCMEKKMMENVLFMVTWTNLSIFTAEKGWVWLMIHSVCIVLLVVNDKFHFENVDGKKFKCWTRFTLLGSR